jgi:uncharacterized repeat protein (TIGR03803 family)
LFLLSFFLSHCNLTESGRNSALNFGIRDYGNQGQLEYDFVVQPGADPASIQLSIVSDEQAGSQQKAVGRTAQPQDPEPESQSAIDNRKSSIAAPLHVNATGDLVVATDGGEVTFHTPVVYQPAAYHEPRTTNKDLVEGKYVVTDNHITFEVANYDKRKPLVIDPALAYSTYLGGSDYDVGGAIAVDASGNAYIAGTTPSSDFPTTAGASQTKYGGGGSGCCGAGDAFVTKLSPGGSALVYSTYLGGTENDNASAIAVDARGNAYVTGFTQSFNFPATPGAFQTSRRSIHGNAFVSKLGPKGSALLYSTFLGGSGGGDGAFGIAVDASGNAYVTGPTYSFDFPTTPGAFQTTCPSCSYGSGFVTKLNAAGADLLYSTFLGVDFPRGIAVDASGSAYVTGETGSSDFPITRGAFQTTLAGEEDAFVSTLNTAGSALLYSTYLGGGVPAAGGEALNLGSGIAIDTSGNAYVTGSTYCTDFPTTTGAFQSTYGGTPCCGPLPNAFVSKFNTRGSALLYSTYLGGSGGSGGSGIALDAANNANVTGNAFGTGFPTTPGAFQTTFGGNRDAFVSKLNSTGSALLYSTYLGGSGAENGSGIAVDASGNAYVTGVTESSNFPVTPGAFQIALGGQADAFVAKISMANVPSVVWTPPSLTFSAQAVGTTSAAQNDQMSDFGTGPLIITNIVASGDFAQSNDCAGTVPPARFCTLSVIFTPTATGIRTGAITITDDAPGSPHELPLTGAGGIPAVSLTPASLTFGPQATGTISPALPVTLKNTGDGPLSITNIAASQRRNRNFAETNDCGSTVNPGASCTLSVTFSPTPQAPQGMLSGDITLTDDAPGSPQTIILSGTVIDGSFFNPNFTTLVQGLDGNLYGTTTYGGTSNVGTVFKVTPEGTVTTIHNFDYADGAKTLRRTSARHGRQFLRDHLRGRERKLLWHRLPDHPGRCGDHAAQLPV